MGKQGSFGLVWTEESPWRRSEDEAINEVAVILIIASSVAGILFDLVSLLSLSWYLYSVESVIHSFPPTAIIKICLSFMLCTPMNVVCADPTMTVQPHALGTSQLLILTMISLGIIGRTQQRMFSGWAHSLTTTNQNPLIFHLCYLPLRLHPTIHHHLRLPQTTFR